MEPELTTNPTIEMSASIIKLAEALVEAQTAMGAATKDAKNPFYNSKYADLSEVIGTCKDALNSNGIAFLQPIISGTKGVCVSTMLLHTSGEWLRATVEFPVGKIDPQEYGKAVSYARRYSLQALLSIPAEDDDGNTASNKGTPSTMAKALTQDFPEGEWLKGTVTKVLPTAGAMPTQVFIQTDNGTMQFSTFLPVPFLQEAKDDAIEFTYGKQGKLRVVTEIRHQDATTAPLPIQAPHGEYQDPPTSAATLPLDSPDEGMPADENFFKPDEDCVGTLVAFDEGSVVVKKTDGNIEVTSWDQPGKWHLNWAECLGKRVWFKAREGREFRGKKQYTLAFLELYNG
jgi:hypothetical protein